MQGINHRWGDFFAERGASIHLAAREVQVTRVTIYRYLDGESSRLSLPRVQKLARLLKYKQPESLVRSLIRHRNKNAAVKLDGLNAAARGKG